MERKIITSLGKNCVGWEDCDGILCPGGSLLKKALPDARKTGLFSGPVLTAYTSAESHYSIERGCMIAGIGSANVRKIPTDDDGSMIVEELQRAIEEDLKEGKKPFYVCATAGSTVFGAFDNFTKISEIAQTFGLWCHVDASWGGGAFYAPVEIRENLVRGISLADSFVMNPHKFLNIPQQCSMLFVKQKGLLEQVFSMRAPYLFSELSVQESMDWNPGDKSMNCARRNDIFKFYLAQQYFGTRGFEQMVENFFALKEYFIAQLKKRANFKLVHEDPKYLNVMFWAIPEVLHRMEDGAQKNKLLSKATVDIGDNLRSTGKFMINYQSTKGLPEFFRMVFNNPNITNATLDYALDAFEYEIQNWVPPQ